VYGFNDRTHEALCPNNTAPSSRRLATSASDPATDCRQTVWNLMGFAAAQSYRKAPFYAGILPALFPVDDPDMNYKRRIGFGLC